MSKLNIFIDGSWLFKACSAEKALASATEFSSRAFRLDFRKLDAVLLRHAGSHVAECDNLGDRYIATSIFELPENFEDWPSEGFEVTNDDVDRVKNNVLARSRFVQGALAVGYSNEAVYYPKLKFWMIDKLRDRRYQEKQVDSTVVALLVRSAIINPQDIHVVITGDADILPAIKVAYPEYSENVLLATVHPDELTAERRQTSFGLSQFEFKIPPLYFQDHVSELVAGDNVYECVYCHKTFIRSSPIPRTARPCCSICNESRT